MRSSSIAPQVMPAIPSDIDLYVDRTLASGLVSPSAAAVPNLMRTERLLEGGSTLASHRVDWDGMRVELKSVKKSDQFVATEILCDSHVLIMGIEGEPQESRVKAEGLPDWRGIKGQGRSSFWSAGRRMRSWQYGESATVLALFFNMTDVEEAIQETRAVEWQSQQSADAAFIVANGVELASALCDGDDALATLRARTIATNLQLYCLDRFSQTNLRYSGGASPIGRAIELIHASFPKAVSLEDLTMASGLSRRHLLLGFRSQTQLTPHQYIINLRLKRAQMLLQTTDRALAEVALDVGCANAEHLGQVFRKQLGMSPRAWRSKAKPT